VLVICLWEKQNSDLTDQHFSLSNSGKSILACSVCLLNGVARVMLQGGVKADISKLKWPFLLCAFQFHLYLLLMRIVRSWPVNSL
jgi:hypothetical protein